MLDVEEKKFKGLSLCPDGWRSWIGDENEDGLEALQSRLEVSVAQTKATTTASRNNQKFMVPDEIREMSALAAQCRDPVRRKVLRKKARKARREFDARVGALPRGKTVKRPVVKKLWINGRASEDRDERNEEVKIHSEKCFDDKSKIPEVQAERIREQRCRGDSVVAFQGRRVQITVDRVIRARGKILKGKSNGFADCFVVEMLSRLPTVVVYEVTHWFQKRFMGISRPLKPGVFYVWYLSRNRMRNWKKVFAGFVRSRIERVLRVVFFGTGGLVTRGEGTNRMVKPACGRRERCQLWAHAGVIDQFTSNTLGMAGRSPLRWGNRASTVTTHCIWPAWTLRQRSTLPGHPWCLRFWHSSVLMVMWWQRYWRRCTYGERHYRRTVGIVYGTQAWIVVVDVLV